MCFLSKPLNFSKSLYLTAALTPTGALFSNSLNILPAEGGPATYFDIPFTPVGLDMSINDLSLSDSLKSNISLSIVSLVAPNSILFKIPSKNSLNKGGKLDFLKSRPFTSISLQGTPSFFVIYCAYLRLP